MRRGVEDQRHARRDAEGDDRGDRAHQLAQPRRHESDERAADQW